MKQFVEAQPHNPEVCEFVSPLGHWEFSMA